MTGGTLPAIQFRRSRKRQEINAIAWLCWLAAVAAVPLMSRNPLYIALQLVIVAVVYLALPKRSSAARAWRLFVVIGLTLSVFSVAFNVLTVHVGNRVFAHVPGWIPIASGKLTWNAFAYGLVSAAAIATLIIGGAAFNTAVRHGDLVRLMPGGLARLGVAGSIALTMAPQMMMAGRDILDAQRARGHRVRGVRDAAALITPLLSLGMERAVTMSEALEVRGFGGSASERACNPAMIALSLIALVCALLALGAGSLIPGVFAMALALVLAARATRVTARRTRLRRIAWNLPSVTVLGGALLALGVVFLEISVFGVSLTWDPFPELTAPTFSPLIGVGLLGLLIPVLWAGSG